MGCQDPGDVVLFAELVIKNIVRDGEICQIPCLSRVGEQACSKVQRQATYVGIIKDGNHDPVKDNKSSEHVNLCPPWDHKGAPNPRNLRPVECYGAHSQTSRHSEELIDGDILWGDPANPRKHRERCKQESFTNRVRKWRGAPKSV